MRRKIYIGKNLEDGEGSMRELSAQTQITHRDTYYHGLHDADHYEELTLLL